jgi:CheY-like chemotaxis protein
MPSAPRVLIVDDDADTLQLYEFALELYGLEVVAARSARDGLRAAKRRAPNVVVTDLAMPGMDGIEFCRALKANEQTRDIPVLAVSGQAISWMESRARAAGCSEVLLKPCEPERLCAVILRVLGESRALRDQARALREEARRVRRQVRSAIQRRRREHD